MMPQISDILSPTNIGLIVICISGIVSFNFKNKRWLTFVNIAIPLFVMLLSVGDNVNKEVKTREEQDKIDVDRKVTENINKTATNTHETVVDVQRELNESNYTLADLLKINEKSISNLNAISEQTDKLIFESTQLNERIEVNNDLKRKEFESLGPKILIPVSDVKFYSVDYLDYNREIYFNIINNGERTATNLSIGFTIMLEDTLGVSDTNIIHYERDTKNGLYDVQKNNGNIEGYKYVYALKVDEELISKSIILLLINITYLDEALGKTNTFSILLGKDPITDEFLIPHQGAVNRSALIKSLKENNIDLIVRN